MNWPNIIKPILAHGYTLAQIADECGFASPGALHDLLKGRQKTCTYERGTRLLDMCRMVERKTRRRKLSAA